MRLIACGPHWTSGKMDDPSDYLYEIQRDNEIERGPRPLYFKVGERVQTHPATVAHSQGDRYGKVVLIDSEHIYVLLESSGRTVAFTPRNIIKDDNDL